MKKEGVPEHGLLLHKKIISRVMKREDDAGTEFEVLKKTLGYTLSAVICDVPRAGFYYLRELSGSEDNEITWIIRETLKKDRLKRSLPGEVRSIGAAVAR